MTNIRRFVMNFTAPLDAPDWLLGIPEKTWVRVNALRNDLLGQPFPELYGSERPIGNQFSYGGGIVHERLQSFLIWGGGHNAGADNGIYEMSFVDQDAVGGVYDPVTNILTGPKWKCFKSRGAPVYPPHYNDPTGPAARWPLGYHTYMWQTGWYFDRYYSIPGQLGPTGLPLDNAIHPNGSPRSAHVYRGWCYVPSQNSDPTDDSVWILSPGGGQNPSIANNQPPNGEIPSWKTITNIAVDGSGVVTITGSLGFNTGDQIYIHDAGGVTELEGNLYLVTQIDASNVTLQGVDGSGYAAYVGGGSCYKETTNGPWPNSAQNLNMVWRCFHGPSGEKTWEVVCEDPRFDYQEQYGLVNNPNPWPGESWNLATPQVYVPKYKYGSTTELLNPTYGAHLFCVKAGSAQYHAVIPMETRTRVRVTNSPKIGTMEGHAPLMWMVGEDLIAWLSLPNKKLFIINPADYSDSRNNVARTVTGQWPQDINLQVYSSEHGAVWHSPSNGFLIWGYRDQQSGEIWKLSQPDRDWWNGEWSWSKVDPANLGAANELAPGPPDTRARTYDNFNIIRNVGGSGIDMLTCIGAVTDYLYVYRLPASGV